MTDQNPNTTSILERLRPGVHVSGPVLPEPIEVIAARQMGESVKLIGKGLKTGLAHDPILSPEQLSQLTVSAEREPFDADASLFRLGVEAHRLGLAFEYDPYFSLSIARIDPLPHQLEAVYDYFLRLPRIRFLLADDPGAGKTIMAGLLLKELKARGLVQRTLIVTPANLSFQWQRELRDKFRERFEVIRSDVLRANYGLNPWQERDQVVTSVSWVSRIEDARESLLRSRWDLIIVDEAHKMSAYADDRKTLAYRLGESLSQMTDHYLLMTATPHKGDPENFRRFLALLDADAYGSVQSLEMAMRLNEAPFYLRRTKEALVTFPHPDTGEVRKLFTNREVRTAAFQLDGDELDFYDQLTRYVEDQSIQASAENSARGRAVGFTMALLQRRMASTIYAVRRTLERMRDRRQKILEDPEAYRRAQIERRLPDDFDDLPEEEREEIIAELEEVVASVNPEDLRAEIARLEVLVAQAQVLERREIESKLTKLRDVLNELGIFTDRSIKLIVFTEHKDSLDFLAGDGKDGRPLGKLVEWGLEVTQIHGGMKIGNRDVAGTRIYAEREFKDSAQVLVATEAAGEGINLQFCWLMINYDIPWNPVRLEQRVGRIHRYGQERDCTIVNFVAENTREGRVLQKLLDRLREIRRELGTDQVFDVVGEIFPSNLLDRLFRDLYARRMDLPSVEDRVVREVDANRFRSITESALEGLAKRELNLSNIFAKSIEAKERRLVPEVVEQFFTEAAPQAGITPRPVSKNGHIYRIGRLPRSLLPRGDQLEPRYGRLGRDYARIAFDKEELKKEPALDWVTPGHPLFEVVRHDVLARTEAHLRRGAAFFDLHRTAPSLLDLFAASIRDGRGQTLHRRLFVVETNLDGSRTLRAPTILLDVSPAPVGTSVPECDPAVYDRNAAEGALLETRLQPWRQATTQERHKQLDMVARHVDISLNALIDRRQRQLAEYLNRQVAGETVPGLDGLIAQAEQHLDDLNNRLESRRREIALERECTIADVAHLGRAWVLPHPERGEPELARMVSSAEIEQIAVRVATAHEEARGCAVESVEAQNRGFDLISRRFVHEGLPPPKPGAFFVYALWCAGGSVYIGQTEDLSRRWDEHAAGSAAEWTRQHKPLFLAYYERYATREDAVAREKQLKSGYGREWLKAHISGGKPYSQSAAPGPACRQAGDPQTAVEVRFIEVKGRAGVGEVAVTTNEYRAAERLKSDYWLYVVFDCLPAGKAGASTPKLHAVQDPARLGWQAIVNIEHYRLAPDQIASASNA